MQSPGKSPWRRGTFLALLATVAILAPRIADAHRPDGARCRSDAACSGGTCVKPAPAPGHSRAVFGACCTPRSCTVNDCGTTANGCGGTMRCSACAQAVCQCSSGPPTVVCSCVDERTCFHGCPDSCNGLCGGQIANFECDAMPES